MGKSYFLEQLEQHHMQEVVVSQIPQKCIIKQQLPLSSLFKLDKVSLYHSVLTEGERGIKTIINNYYVCFLTIKKIYKWWRSVLTKETHKEEQK